MQRLIDANEILQSEHQHYDYMADEYYVLVRDIENAPTVDAEPVRHGHWIERTKVYPALFTDSTYIYECSNCGYMDTHGANVEVPYCWHCGARMDESTMGQVKLNEGERREDAEH